MNLWPNLHLKETNFDWLGELPAISEARSGRDSLKASLADLDASDPASLRAAGNRAINVGTKEGIEAGTRLHAMAQARENLSQKAASENAYYGILPGLLQRQQGRTPDDIEPRADPIYPPQPGRPDAIRGGSDPFATAPNPLATPGPQTAAPPSPSDELINQAQAGATPQQPGVQLAGPLPEPEAPQTPVPGLEMTRGPLPKVVPPQQGYRYPQGDNAGALTRARQIAQDLLSLPKGAPAGAVQALRAEYASELDKTKMSPAEKEYQTDRLQSLYDGRGDLSRKVWQDEKTLGAKPWEGAAKHYTGIEEKGDQASETGAILGRLSNIMKDPNFVSGTGANLYAQVVSGMGTLAKIAGIADFDMGALRDKIKSITDPHMKATALITEFNSLANTGVLATAGSLSKGFSEGDRTFTERIFPSILATPEGNQKIIDDLQDMAKYHREIAAHGRAYMNKHGSQATEYGLRTHLGEWTKANPLFQREDGSLTDAGQRAAAKAKATGSATPAPVVPSAPITLTPQDEGRKGTDASGNEYIIRGGKPVPTGRKQEAM